MHPTQLISAVSPQIPEAENLIYDLETLTPADKKEEARKTIVAHLQENSKAAVRINDPTTETGQKDLAALKDIPHAYLVLPMIRTPETIKAVRATLHPETKLAIMIETKETLKEVGEYLKMEEVDIAILGFRDLADELDLPELKLETFTNLRRESALLARANDKILIDGIYPKTENPVKFLDDCRKSRIWGCHSRLCLTKEQYEVLESPIKTAW